MSEVTTDKLKFLLENALFINMVLLCKGSVALFDYLRQIIDGNAKPSVDLMFWFFLCFLYHNDIVLLAEKENR